jgi:hypothetical protein
MELRQEHFSGVVWNDISIQKIDDHDKLLILICENNEQSVKLYHIITSYSYDIKLSFNTEKELIVRLDFINTEFYIELNTHRKEEIYYPIGWLRGGLVNYVTAGHWLNDSTTDMFKPYQRLINPAKIFN